MALIRDFLSIGQINNPELYIAMHQHNIWELVYYTYGSGIMTVGSCQYPFKKGDIMLLPADIPHSEMSELGYRNYHMLFKRAALNKKDNCVFKVSDNEGSDVFYILQLIYRTFHLKPGNWPQIIQWLFDTLDGYLFVLSGESRKSQHVEKLESLIVENISNPDFELDKAMAGLPVSREYLRRVFKKYAGMPPQEYLTNKRLEYARKLLESYGGSVRIKDIAAMAGYQDQYYFSRAFSKAFGKSPRGWLKDEMCL